jgi:Tol biopolymer transport system component
VDSFVWDRVSGEVPGDAHGTIREPTITLPGLADTARLCIDVRSRRKGDATLSEPLHTCWPAEAAPLADQPLPDDVLVLRQQDEGVRKITSVNLQGARLRVLLSSDSARAPVISRDRRSVYYIREEVDSTSMWAVAADGGTARMLFSDGSPHCPRIRRPAARSDGVLVLVCGSATAGGPDSLNEMTLEGGFIKKLATGHLGDPTLSADGGTVVYTKSTTSNFQDGGPLYRVALDGPSRETRLTEDVAINPVFSPKEDVVAYERIDSPTSRSIASLSLTGRRGPEGQPLTTPPDGAMDRDPSWSPDGTRLAFRRMVSTTEGDLVVINADPRLDNAERVPTTVPQTHGRLTAPVWTTR